MPNYNFAKDLPVAKQTEKEVAERLQEWFGAEIIEIGLTNEYDILTNINGHSLKFEVKEDFSCERTGNIALEFSCRNKPSGIQTTRADYYIYKVHTKDNGIQYVLHKLKDLKRMVEQKKYFRIVNGGDIGSNSLNYLFKYDEFIKHGKVLPNDSVTLLERRIGEIK